jgi:hypothetical protein
VFHERKQWTAFEFFNCLRADASVQIELEIMRIILPLYSHKAYYNSLMPQTKCATEESAEAEMI